MAKVGRPAGILAIAAVLLISIPGAAVGRQMAIDGLPLTRSAIGSEQIVRSARLTSPITMDGVVDESAWQQARIIDNLVQDEPDEGAPPYARTEVRILHDDRALYVSAMMYDPAPDSIVSRLVRRDDDVESDHFVIFLDPYLDRMSGYYFGVNAAGTLYDGVMMSDESDDDSWDGVWEARVQHLENGWSTEFRIPFSQMRFRDTGLGAWGVNLRRGIARRNEIDMLVYTPRNERGFVSRFASLDGLGGINPVRQLEISPYSRMRATYTALERRGPFDDGSTYAPAFGVDMKAALATNLTLNATINPDFGQVEVDPAVVNLSDFETFYPEKRPFFVEGSSVFSQFGRGGTSQNWSFNWGNPSLFYTRRVGRSPQIAPPDAQSASVPDATRILGAAKITGRLGSGWNVGLVQALTALESADLSDGDRQWSAEAEPFSSYSVARVQREFDEGFSGLGVMGTMVRRNFQEDRSRDQLNGSATVLAADGWRFLDRDRTWVGQAWMAYSRLTGTQERMLALQSNPYHYYQRPDIEAVTLDPTATSLEGVAGRFTLVKNRGATKFNGALGVISPGFDVNDAGYMYQTNQVNAHVAAGYQWSDPTSWYRVATLLGSVFGSTDFDGNITWAGVWALGEIQFVNYHSMSLMAAWNPRSLNIRRTRGGPITVNRPGAELRAEYESDDRKALVAGFEGSVYARADAYQLSAGPRLRWQPATNIQIGFEPSLGITQEFAQWVGVWDDATATTTYGRRYVFGEMSQVELASTIRLNWTFSPVLSLQLFAQPLVSSADYDRFKVLRRSRSYDFMTFGEEGSTFDRLTLQADPDGAGPAPSIALPNPDFTFRSVRGTAVLRWEFRPGSVLYLVWTQQRSEAIDDGAFRLSRSLRALGSVPGDNVFMVKLNYWLGR